MMEEIGLIFEFVEQNYRGSNEKQCPDFKSLLKMVFVSENWNAGWRDGDRIIYAENVIGHDGLYEDIDSRVEWSEV